MRTLINEQNQFPLLRSDIRKTLRPINLFVLILLSVVFSGSSLIPQENAINYDVLKNKKLEILEKLENGKAIRSEDIRSSFGDFRSDVSENEEPESTGNHSFPGPFFYHDFEGEDHVIISDNDIKAIHKRLYESMKELRKNIESFRNSEDFLIMEKELNKWSENFRIDLEKMREDIIRTGKETRSKGTVNSLI